MNKNVPRCPCKALVANSRLQWDGKRRQQPEHGSVTAFARLCEESKQHQRWRLSMEILLRLQRPRWCWWPLSRSESLVSDCCDVLMACDERVGERSRCRSRSIWISTEKKQKSSLTGAASWTLLGPVRSLEHMWRCYVVAIGGVSCY